MVKLRDVNNDATAIKCRLFLIATVLWEGERDGHGGRLKRRMKIEGLGKEELKVRISRHGVP